MKSPNPNSFPILLFWRLFTLRHAGREWIQTTLLLLILALGVGTFLSIRLANRAAVEGFQLFTDSLRGPSDWIVETRGGGLSMVELETLRSVLDPLPAALFPVIEDSIAPLPKPGQLDAAGNTQVKLLGLDLVQIRGTAAESEIGGGPALWELLGIPDHLLVSREVAEQWEVTAGDTIKLVLNGRTWTFTIKGILPEFRDGTPLPRRLAIMDLAALMGRLDRGTVDRVEVILPEGPLRDRQVEEAARRLHEAAGSRWVVGSPNGKEAEGAAMTAAFRLNLTVLSLIALLVGMYLIAQTLDSTVSRRRREIATLRSLGISPREIHRLWLSEAVLYGLVAGFLGLLAGHLLASFTVEAVTSTVRALYRDTVADSLKVTGGDILLSIVLGLGGSLFAAWIPARDAASTPPAQFLRMGKRIPPFPGFQHPWLGFIALLGGALLLLLPPLRPEPGTQIPVAGYATALLWLAGGTLVAVACLKWTGWMLHRLSGGSAILRLAGSRLREPTSRHQLALSGFFVAIGMVAAMAYLIASFEHTVTGWLQHRLRADLFVSSIGFQGSDSGQQIPGALLDSLEREDAIRVMDRFRSVDMEVKGVPTVLGGVRFDLLGSDQRLLWLQRPASTPQANDTTDADGYANENMVRRSGLRIGDVVEISTPSGPRRIRIAGIHADYARDNGLLLIDLPLLMDWYQLDDYTTASIFLEQGRDPGKVQGDLREKHPGLAIRQNGELMETALFIFNQTFAVTYALQAIGLFVALTGLALSLLSLLRESSGELALQGMLGMSRREIALTTAVEGTGVALTGLASGLVLSVALGNVLIFVINRQSFGWTLQTAWPSADIASLAVSVLLLGFAISYLTGRLHLAGKRMETGS
jgi:putative ABC transport system permease protein